MSLMPAHQWPRQRLLTRVASWLLNPHGAPSQSRLRTAVGGKTVLITGASFGIGEATARLLGAAGAKVLLVARSRDQLELVAAAIRSDGGTAEVHPADLTDTDAVADLARRLLDAHGPIDIVVSNAGKSIRRSVALSYDRFHDFERTIGVNYLGPVRLLLALLPGMRRRRSGQIINVSTFGVRVPPGPRWGAYQASKAAFDAWFRSMGVEARSDGVATSTIYLPLVYTRMSAPTPSIRGLPGLYPEQAAGLIARAIVRRSRVIAPWWLLPARAVRGALPPADRVGAGGVLPPLDRQPQRDGTDGRHTGRSERCPAPHSGPAAGVPEGRAAPACGRLTWSGWRGPSWCRAAGRAASAR